MYRSLTILFAVAYVSSFGTEKLSDIYPNRERVLYLDLGENVVITDKNVSVARSHGGNVKNVTFRGYCVLEVETCTSCLISVKFRYLNLKDTCGKRMNIADVSACRCDYIWIAETPYEEISGKPFCGYWNSVSNAGTTYPTYRSQTRSVTITFFYVDGANHEFVIHLSSERNQNFYYGNPQDSDMVHSSTGVLTSPFFPAQYPPDVVTEYVITCLKRPDDARNSAVGTKDTSENCRIHLLFTDFLLASVSVIEFFEGDQQRIDLASGASFRPPVILSNSSRLKIRFTANGGRSPGFKALFSFIQGNQGNPLLEPNTDCGGIVEDLGGLITMVNMVSTGRKVFDCIWLIRPPERIYTAGGSLYLKVNTFTGFGDYAVLEIREGHISESPLLEKILHSNTRTIREHITSPGTGFYVNMRAVFEPSSILGITFASFHLNKCYTGPEFLCRNHRCISRKVVCDGFDHCGDNSDETELCFKDWLRKGRKWDTLTPNYYFPKVEHFSELRTATLVFIVSSLGLILFLAILIILLYGMGSRSRQNTDLQSRLQTITDLLDDAEIEEIIDDEPPNYEAPPEYEVAMLETACIFKRHQVNGSGSSEGKVIIIIPESVTNSSCERLNEGKNTLQQSANHSLSVSPPPPYVEDSNGMSCRREEQQEEESVSTGLPPQLMYEEDENFNRSSENKIEESS